MKVKPYNIRRGDTLGAIAALYGITLQELLDENPAIDNPNLILVGQIILVPNTDTDISIHRSLAEKNIAVDLPVWLKIAMREEGVTEVPRAGNNPRIIEYHSTTSLARADARRDSTPWCSSFVNWCMEQAKMNGTDSAWARSWDDWKTKLQSPRSGCITVFSRESNRTKGGHVGFFLSDTKSTVEVLGGNQGNKVSRSTFPKNGKRGSFTYKLLSHRWPS